MSFLAVNKRVNGVDTLFQTSPLSDVTWDTLNI